MNPMDLAAAVRHRWRLVGLVTLATLLLVVAWTSVSRALYQSSSALVFGSFDPGATTDRSGDQSSADAAFVATQADVINSDFVAQQVVAALNLTDRPNVAAQWRAATGGRGSIESWLARRLLGGLSVVPTRSNVLRISYKTTSPDAAAAIANAFADAYIRTQLMLRVQPARVYSDWFQQRTRDVRSRLEQAQARLTRYQRDHALVGGGGVNVDMSRLVELSGQLTAAEAANADVAARASGDIASSPEVQSSGVVQGLRSAIATTSAHLGQLQSTLGPNHPDVVTTRAELATLQAKLAQAVGEAARALRVASAASAQRESAMRRRVAEQRAEVLAQSGNQDALAVLQRDVDTARLAYDAVTQRLNTMRLQSELPQANASLLDRAAPSYLPVSPNVPIRLLLGLMLGLGAGVSLVLLLEWREPRVRTEAGLVAATQLPLLANLELGPLQGRLPFRKPS